LGETARPQPDASQPGVNVGPGAPGPLARIYFGEDARVGAAPRNELETRSNHVVGETERGEIVDGVGAGYHRAKDSL
jgi:hypothetical protein